MKPKPISTIFFGTHDFAATILQSLIDSPTVSVEMVITQPDRPVGRKQEVQKSPVKILAEKNNIIVEQPESLKNYELRTKNCELNIVAQYGLLIPKNIINAPAHGTLNVHTSLLPKYRGASPIQSAIMDGETETGVTIMKMDEGLDTGPILLQKSLNIEPDDTYPELDKKMAKIGSEALLEAIPPYIEGGLQPAVQDNSKATVCKQLSRDDGLVDWSKSADEIYNLYRGLTPWPGIWTMLEGKRLKLLKIKPADENIEAGSIKTNNGKMYIACGKKSIEVLELQLEGKKAMSANNFLTGHRNIDGIALDAK